MKQDNTELFERMPVSKAVVALIVPTVISQLITVVYNMADTFFIGQVGDPNQVAAVSLCMPTFVLLTSLANLFGIGGASLMSRCFGRGDHAKARRIAAFSVWTSAGIALLYGVLLYGVRGSILPLIGANEGTYTFCSQYVFWTVTIGAVPTVLNQELAHLVVEGTDSIIRGPYPLILVIENDIAKVLGNAINVLLERKKDVICIDGIHTNNGDYIDIGEPVGGGHVVPVVTKTLIFNT